MIAKRLCATAMVGVAMLGLDHAALADAPIKIGASRTPTAPIAALPAAGREAKAAARQGIEPVTPAAASKFNAGAGLADLVPGGYYGAGSLPEGFPGVQFCDPNPAGGVPNKLRYRITNQGGTGANAFAIRFDFVGAAPILVQANGLDAGQEKSGAVSIPAGCFPDGYSTMCQFSVTVDSASQVGESSEANNTMQSFCVGPAT